MALPNRAETGRRPLRNRVTPTGEIIATPHRGTLMGNRGVIHDGRGEIVRPFRVKRWIACRLEFKGRRRELLRPGRWTELFFLDEATALAAGHRPCAECRREDYRRWQAAWAAAFPGEATSADAMDERLHADRLGPRPLAAQAPRGAAGPPPAAAGLSPGIFVALDGASWLVTDDGLREWTPGGYGARRARADGSLRLVTPASTAAVIAAGYAPALHPSAHAA
jgi:hypothetical protein